MPRKKTVSASATKKPTVKRTRRTKAEMQAAAGAVAPTAKGSPQDVILNALSKILELAKAQLYDMFRMYVQSKIQINMPATLEDFIAAWSNVLSAHGIKEEELVAALSPHQKDYLFECAKRIETGTKNNTTFVKPSGVQIQEGQAEKINAKDFGAVEAPKPPAPSKTNSVFADLDVL